MLDKIVNTNLLREPFNWVIVPLVLIMAGLALSLVMGQHDVSKPINSPSSRG